MVLPLSPKAQRRLTREASSLPFGKAAQALNEDWGSENDGKQIQRSSQWTLSHHSITQLLRYSIPPHSTTTPSCSIRSIMSPNAAVPSSSQYSVEMGES